MNMAMATIERLRNREHKSKKDMVIGGSRSTYYAQMEAEDIKVMDFKRYLNLLGYELIIRERKVTPFEMPF